MHSAPVSNNVRYAPIATVALQCSGRRYGPTADIAPLARNYRRGHRL